MTRPGADLIAHYLDPDRLPVHERWSRKHTHTQARLCDRFAAPVIGVIACQDIKTGHMQRIVNSAPTPGEGTRVRRMISAMVSAGLDGGYLANPRLAKVHWQAGDRQLPAPKPAARVLHHRLVHLEARGHRRLSDGRPLQLPHHPGHVRRLHRRRPRPRPHGHRVTTPTAVRGPARRRAGPDPRGADVKPNRDDHAVPPNAAGRGRDRARRAVQHPQPLREGRYARTAGNSR
jgi:hypothetical protein